MLLVLTSVLAAWCILCCSLMWLLMSHYPTCWSPPYNLPYTLLSFSTLCPAPTIVLPR